MAVAGRANEADSSSGDAGPRRFAGLAASARNLTTFLAGFVGSPPSQNDNRPAHREPGPAVELDCLRDAFPPSLLAAAERRSDQIGVGADQVLIQWGVISEEAYLDRLASHVGLDIETLDDISRNDCLLPDGHIHLIARHGILPIRRQGDLVYVSAPRGYTARRIVRLIAQYPSLVPRLRLTSTSRFNEFLEIHSDGALACIASDGLAARLPNLSAAPAGLAQPPGFFRSVISCDLHVPVTLLTLAPLTLSTCAASFSPYGFCCSQVCGWRGVFRRGNHDGARARLHDSQLPVYTVVAALYREASSVAPLMQHIGELDYPREKLDIKLVDRTG